MKLIEQASLILLAVLLFSTCQSDVTGPGDTGPNGELPRDLSASEMKIVEADQSFSYRILSETIAYDHEVGNIMISPLSISMALAIALNGAEGQTYEDMRETLPLSDMDLEEVNEAFESLIELLTTADPEVTMMVANSIWHRNELPVKEDFLEGVEKHFGALIEGLDFSDPAAVDIINDWVNENTEG